MPAGSIFPRPTLALGAAWLVAALPVAQAQAIANCRSIADDARRLACYDQAAGASPATTASPAGAMPAPTAPPTASAAPATAAPPSAATARNPLGSSMVERWELEAGERHSLFLPRPYKPVYVQPVVITNRVNRSPASPTQQTTPPLDLALDNTEAKFQISLKAKLAEGLFGGHGDLWAGYTQSSRWQVYNAELSRPFRETNYEPEAMLVFATDYPAFGLRGRLLGISLNHQSNGRADPLSRSWNRVIGMAGFEQGDWAVMVRPWWRIPEDASVDNNPDIGDHLGRAEAVITRRWGGHLFALQVRHSLKGGERSRGSAELEWAFPIAGTLRGQVQLFSGYGESLIDYNFRQTRLGLGVSLVDWR